MAAAPEQPAILSFEDARHVVERHAAGVQPGEMESVALLSSIGRVLAQAVVADRDFPPFRRAMRDGYAVRTSDLGQLPSTLEVLGEIKAGANPEEIPARLDQGQAASIMTGAPAPPGADAVVMIEHTSRNTNRVTVKRSVKNGDNIVPEGAEARQGDRLVEAGTAIDYGVLAVAASVGATELRVFRRPVVCVLATGDELVEIDRRPGPTQIRNSNSYSLAAQVVAAGAIPRLLGIARDEADDLRRLVARGLESDLLLLSGGVSMGQYDLVEEVLSEFGAEFLFTGALIQPGRPVVFGRARAKYFFGLPGNPVSTMVTFELFVRPLLDALCGLKPRTLHFLHARLKSEIQTKTGLKRFLPGVLSGELEKTEVALARWQGSGDVASSARANCYIVVPPDRERIAAGEWVAVMLK
jgi:molybdopterin molybdotransferase